MPPNTPGPVQPPQQPQPGPAQPLPGAPQVSSYPSAGPAPLPEIAPAPQPAGSNRTRLVLVILGALVAVFVIGLLATKALSHPITKHQVTVAQNTADDFNDDVFKAAAAINKAEEADTAAAVKSNVDEANSKLDDARKNMAALQKSEVMSDTYVKEAFDALNSKWKPYQTYLRDSAKDTQALMPVLLDFTDKIDVLYKSEPTAANIPTYLAQIKQIIDSTSGQLDKMDLALPEDKDILAAFKADLSASSTAVTKAQADLAAGQPLYIVQDDLLAVLDAQSTFSDKIDKSSQQLTDKAADLDPGRTYNKFQAALKDLWSKAKN